MSQNFEIITTITRANNNDLLVKQGFMKFGQPYYILSKDGKSFSGIHILDKYHNYEKLKELQQAQRIYIPVIEYDKEIAIELQQQDLKETINQ